MKATQMLKAEIAELDIDLNDLETILDIPAGKLQEKVWDYDIFKIVYEELRFVFEVSLPELPVLLSSDVS